MAFYGCRCDCCSSRTLLSPFEQSVPTGNDNIRPLVNISSLSALPTLIHPTRACIMYQHLNFEKSYNLQFPLLSDIGANVADLYGSKLDIPFMGKFANRLTFIIGSDGKIEKVYYCIVHT